ncbi:MAG: hypothetical protein K6C08_10605 [Oscillospiraceae bacterium]|nr:hypothetical protein [Oscillospiraceae bacterium]
MAEKLFVNGQTEEVRSDYESAKQFEKVRVGSLGVYFRDGLKTRYIKYQEVDRAFIRIQETRSRMCCGQANFNYFRLVFVKDGKEFADVMSENEKAMDDALAEIAAHGVAVGYVKPEAATA